MIKMIRENKFRVWDTYEQRFWSQEEMTEVGGFYYTWGVTPPEELYPNRFILQQYTGLRDNTKWKDLTEEERSKWTKDGNIPSEWNGKEIYEGDILTHEGFGGSVDKPKLKVMKWDKTGWQPSSSFKNWNKCILIYKVIGNICENKELLEAK